MIGYPSEMEVDPNLAQRWQMIHPVLNEFQRRLVLAAEAKLRGRGGIAVVASSTGVSRNTIVAGLKDLEKLASGEKSVESREETPGAFGRIRRIGAGRKRLATQDATLVSDLLSLVDPLTRGDPESPLRWTCKSLRTLAAQLRSQGHTVSHVVVGQLLKAEGYSLQAHAKVIEGTQNPDRNAQFDHINGAVASALSDGQPVISVDTKKKELVGLYKNSGREWQPKGTPVEVKVHDFVDPDLGRANPYGVYDLAADEAWVSVGTDHDTAAFAVETIRRWWFGMGQARYPRARRLLITADGGGSNSSRARLWKRELSRLAQETSLEIQVCHFPPGTSKWNKIEHRLFSFITMNWRGHALVSHEVIVNLIANTTNKKGLNVVAKLDTTKYPKGLVVSDEEFAKINIDRNEFHGDWNYSIRP
jgi:hypothetical protein